MAMTLILSGCSVTKRHYAPGYHVEWHSKGIRPIQKESAPADKQSMRVEESTAQASQETESSPKAEVPLSNGDVDNQLKSVDGFSGEIMAEPSAEESAQTAIIESDGKSISEREDENRETPRGEDSLAAPPTENNIFAIMGLIFSIIPSFWLLGVVFSIIGLVQIKKEGGEGKKLAIAGLVICGAWLLLSLLYIVIYAVLLSQAIA